MSDPILYAIPFFLLFLTVEVLVLRHAAHEHAEDPSTPVGYAAKDTATSLTMGLGSLGFKAVLKLVALVVFVMRTLLVQAVALDDTAKRLQAELSEVI